MEGLPSGTVTFLFSDVVGSTRLWAADSEAMSASLRIHDGIFTEVISTFGGHVFSTAGDSFAVAFDRASAGVGCAERLQERLSEVAWGAWPQLRVRIGMHVGEAEERDGNYFGPAVNQAARVMAVAHGGQCVVTDGVRDAAGAVTMDLGTHLLRDIETPVHLNQLGEQVFPALWSVGAGIVSLPSPRTSLVGRDESVQQVRRLIGAHRLVTLTGVGGCGKTRLVIEAAYREVPAHPEGVWFVDLSTIADEQAVPGAFASALRAAITPGAEAIEQIAAYLEPREALLVVDNCEHVIDVVADFLDVLLARCPRLRVVATSREMLGIDGEFAWKVPSLATGADAPAVQLFIERADAVGAVVTGDADVAVITEIVERLDGIPLAIELAAARARSMDVTEVRDRLDDRFRLLSGGARRTRQRQATLEGAVQWSYDLLSGDEQAMLGWLSVFQGGFEIADVAAVAGVASYEALDLVDSLAAKSLVDVGRDGGGHLRHRLLETIRLFALSRLVDAGLADTARDRHLDHFANDPIGTSMEVRQSLGGLVRIGQEYENFRAAATWALERGRPEATARIAAVAAEPGVNRGEVTLILEWLRVSADLERNDQIFVHAILSWQLTLIGEFVAAGSASQVALAACDPTTVDLEILILDFEASRLMGVGAFREAEILYERARRLAYEHSGVNVRAGSDVMKSLFAASVCRYEEAIELAEASMAAAPDYGYRHGFQAVRAFALMASGRLDEAAEAVASFSPVPAGSMWEHLNLLATHTVMAHTHGPEAAARAFAPVARERASRRPQVTSDLLQGFAYIAHVRGDHERVEEITSNTAPFGAGSYWHLLVLGSLGATKETFFDLWDAYLLGHPVAERFVRDAQHRHRLLAEEVATWSPKGDADARA